MILIFCYSHDLIQKGVKMETSLLASHKAAGEVIDELVMDEQYEIMFKRLFLQAHAEVISKLSVNYLMDTPTDLEPVFAEFSDFSKDRDFLLFLNMHSDFPLQYKKSIGILLEQYILDFICYRWLETKSPQDAQTYGARLTTILQKIQVLLIRKTTPLRRLPSFP